MCDLGLCSGESIGFVGEGGRKKEKERDGGEGRRREEGEPEASERGNARLDSSDRRREGVHFSSLAYFMRSGCFFFELELILWIIGRKYSTRPGLISSQSNEKRSKRNTTRL
jgi:hypothetical protein